VARTQSALNDYQALTDRSRALQWRFNLLLLIVSLLIVVVAIWFAILLASRLVRPIAELAEAAERVGSGDFDVRVPPGQGDEIATLTRAFNRMTGQLKAQQAALVSASTQAEARRRFTEAVLAGVSAGVLSIDAGGIIRLANASAETLLAAGPQGLVGRRLADVEPAFADLLETARAEGIAGAEISRPAAGRAGESQSLAVRLTADPGGARNYILTFDDITQQLADQRRAAWSDVARRIAHEIKNPLTPIILSAERLKRRFAPADGPDRATFGELTDTIIRQVGDLRRMVDEFSAFARMPAPTFRTEDVADIVRQAVFLAEVAQPDIRFRIVAAPDLPPLVCDRRQIGQLLTNILKNAAEAIAAAGRADGAVTVTLTANGRTMTVAIADNGVGLPAALRERLTEPYVTTRARGTGLGLAIVKRIVEDHAGQLDLADRPEGGAIATLRFDLAQNAALAAPQSAEVPA
jgi:two-component system nitrogen regulation sensor histidine kinase NtrY